MAKVGLWLRDGIYYLRWRADGRQFKQSLGHGDKKLAQSQAKQKELELANCPKGKFRRSVKIWTLCENYLEANRRIEGSTVDLTKRAFSYLVSVVGDIDVSRFSYNDAEKFQRWAIDTGRAKTTANIWTKTVRPVFRWAILQGLIAEDPFERLGLFRIPKQKIRIYSQAEYEAMFIACRSIIWKVRLLLAKTTAMRRGEILNLTVEDIDFDKGFVYVQPKSDTKSTWPWSIKDKDNRTLPLVESAARLLSEVLLDLPAGQPYLCLTAELYQRRIRQKRAGKLNDRLRGCPDENFRKPFKRILKRAAVRDGTFHDLRRTCITEWLESGLRPHQVMVLAGHASIDTTMEYYMAIRDELIDQARTASEKCLATAK